MILTLHHIFSTVRWSSIAANDCRIGENKHKTLRHDDDDDGDDDDDDDDNDVEKEEE